MCPGMQRMMYHPTTALPLPSPAPDFRTRILCVPNQFSHSVRKQHCILIGQFAFPFAENAGTRCECGGSVPAAAAYRDCCCRWRPRCAAGSRPPAGTSRNFSRESPRRRAALPAPRSCRDTPAEQTLKHFTQQKTVIADDACPCILFPPTHHVFVDHQLIQVFLSDSLKFTPVWFQDQQVISSRRKKDTSSTQ